MQSKSTLPQRTQKISSANKAWDGISWSWEQSRQLAALLRKIFPYIFPISDSQLSVALVSNKCHSTPDEKHHIALCKQEMRSASDDSVKTLEGSQHSDLDCIWIEEARTFLFLLPHISILGTFSSGVTPIQFFVNIFPRQTVLPITANLVFNLAFTPNIK